MIIREHAAVFERFDLIVSADVADGRVPDRRARRRPAGDVRVRPADDPLVHRRAARGSRSRAGSPRACRSACSSSGRSSPRTRSSAPATRSSVRSVRLRPGAVEMSWEPVIGLEIHVHLKTRTKMFCRCETGFGAPENTRTCPVCLAHPGALPVPNRTAVEWTIKLGLALGSEIAERAVFHRKNYFYPDNPKGYQISQYDEPLCVGGRLVVPGDGRRLRGRLRPRAPRGGRGEDRSRRRRHRAQDRRRALADRLQPRRDAAGRDRHAARPPLGRARRALPPAAPPDDRLARHLRCADGGGDAALRRERLRPAGRLRRAAHALGAEEHELVPLHRARDRRGRPRGRSSSTRAGERSSSTPTTTSPTPTR